MSAGQLVVVAVVAVLVGFQVWSVWDDPYWAQARSARRALRRADDVRRAQREAHGYD